MKQTELEAKTTLFLVRENMQPVQYVGDATDYTHGKTWLLPSTGKHNLYQARENMTFAKHKRMLLTGLLVEGDSTFALIGQSVMHNSSPN